MNEARCPSYEELMPLVGGDTATAAVQTHVAECADCRRRVDDLRGDLDELRDASDDSGPPPPPPSRPAMIGKYFVVGSLDSGGQARVFRALHPLLDQEVVIKLSREPLGQSSADRHLLVAEGKVLARLEHPNLARVYDLDFHDDMPFLAMEYVRGPNLARHAAETPVAPRRAAALVAETARALAVVHKHGIVHQDVKPHNILVGEDGRPRLIDFGLVRLRHHLDTASTDPLGGTPAFMAPEQARGDLAEIGPRSDLFALGGVLYFLLTGKAPFAAESAGLAVEKAKRCDFDRDALKRAGAPRRLEAICMKALAAKPADRYARAEELADDLERYARPRRRVPVLAALAALAALVLVGLWVATRPSPPPVVPAPAADVADLTVRVARNDHYLDLASALPLQTATDKVEVVGKIPAGQHGVLIHVDTRGKVSRLPTEESPADAFTRLIFPGRGGQAPFDPDSNGTELLLLCAAPDADQLEGLEDLVAEFASRLPRLPPQILVRLNRDEPKVEEHNGFGTAEPDAATRVEMRLDDLRRRLCKKHLSVILGVAFSH